MTTRAHVVDMANQSARNFGTLDPPAAAEATAVHICDFWTLRMRTLLAEAAGDDDAGLSPVARNAARIAAAEIEQPTS